LRRCTLGPRAVGWTYLSADDRSRIFSGELNLGRPLEKASKGGHHDADPKQRQSYDSNQD
jgi:hypothetical protein